MNRTAAALLCATAILFAAKEGSGPFGKVGFTRSTFSFTEPLPFDPMNPGIELKTTTAETGRFAPTFLVGAEYAFAPVVSVAGAVGMQFIGCTFESIEYNLTMVNFPVDLKLTVPIRRGGIYILGGPRFDLVVGGKYGHVESDTRSDVSEAFDTFNFQLGLGVGGEIPVKSHHILVEATYSGGISKLMHGDIDNNTSVLLFSVGFRY